MSWAIAITVGIALYVVFVLAVGAFLSLRGWHDHPEEPVEIKRDR